MSRSVIVGLGVSVLLFTLTSDARGGANDPASATMMPAKEFVGGAPRIVNGTLTSLYPTTGALLFLADPTDPILHLSGTTCTGTLVGCSTFLTAAHCVCESPKVGADCQGANAPNPSGYLVFLQHAGFFAVSSIAVNPDYKFGVASDVAIVKLSVPVTGIGPTSLNTTGTPPADTPGTIVGFGRTGGDPNANKDTGLKRVGKVTTSTCAAGIPNTAHVCWEFVAPVGPPGEDSGNCQGDSGGPLFVDLGSGDMVAGVTSGGQSTTNTCLAPNDLFDANVFYDRLWLQGQGGADLSNASCGGIPQVGKTGTIIYEASGQLSSATEATAYNQEVPSGTTLLRVALNGEEPASNNDFDLYVRGPTSSDFDCISGRFSQYEFCEIENPAAGTWAVVAVRVTGAGTYQLTATTIGGSSSKAQQACTKEIRTRFTAFFKAKLGALDTCIDKVNKGKATPPCPDATAAAAIAKAASKVDPVKIAKKCPADVISTLGLTGACTGAADANDLAACIVSETEAAVDAVVAVEYSKPNVVLDSKQEQKCQSAVATAAGKQYAVSRLNILSKCLTDRDKGKVSSCPDAAAQKKLTKAVAKVGSGIGKKCTDALVQSLNSASFGGSCSTATTVTALSSCQVAEHDAATDALLSRLQ